MLSVEMFWYKDLPPTSLDKIAVEHVLLAGKGVQNAIWTPQISSKRQSVLLSSPNSLG